MGRAQGRGGEQREVELQKVIQPPPLGDPHVLPSQKGSARNLKEVVILGGSVIGNLESRKLSGD